MALSQLFLLLTCIFYSKLQDLQVCKKTDQRKIAQTVFVTFFIDPFVSANVLYACLSGAANHTMADPAFAYKYLVF